MKLDDEALPIHEDADVKVRPRIFFEGNLFIDVRPGHAGQPRGSTAAHDPGLPDLGAGPDRPGARHAQDRHPRGPAEAADRLRRGHQRRAAAGRGRRPGLPRSRARPPARRSTSRSTTRPTRCAARPIVNQALLGTRAARPLEAGRQPAEGLRGARHARELSSRTSSPTSTPRWGRWPPRRTTCARRSPAARGARGRQPRARQPQRRLPPHARLGPRDDPRRPRDAGHDRGRLPLDHARPRALLQPARAAGAGGRAAAGGRRLRPVHRRPARAAAGDRPVQPLPARGRPAHRRAARSRTATSRPGCATTRSSSRRLVGARRRVAELRRQRLVHPLPWRAAAATRCRPDASGRRSAPLFANATAPPLGTRPASAPSRPTSRTSPATATAPNLNAAQIGAGP